MITIIKSRGAETRPERVPPDPNKPKGAEVRYTDVNVFGLVEGARE